MNKYQTGKNILKKYIFSITIDILDKSILMLIYLYLRTGVGKPTTLHSNDTRPSLVNTAFRSSTNFGTR